MLPITDCRSCRLCGFEPEDQQLWADMVPGVGRLSDGPHADLWLVNADRWVNDTPPGSLDVGLARVVCVVGCRKKVIPWRQALSKTFPLLREYALLPSANPRVVVPLSSSRAAMAALGLHRPGRRLARLGVRVALLLARMGNYSLLRSRVLLIASSNPAALPVGAEQSAIATHIDETNLDYALYLGTPDDNRKTVILPLGKSEPVTLIKVATTSRARAALKKEGLALAVLGKTPLASAVPRLGSVVEQEGTVTLYQEYRQRRAVSGRKTATALASFLGVLSGIGRDSRPLEYALDGLPRDMEADVPVRCAAVFRGLSDRLRKLSQSGEVVWYHHAHGDFAPWNCTWTRQGLFVFDWEESKKQDLAFSDAFYYVVAPALHVQGKPDAHQTVMAALHLARRAADAGGLDWVDLRIYLALWLIQRAGNAVFYKDMLQSLASDWR